MVHFLQKESSTYEQTLFVGQKQHQKEYYIMDLINEN